MKLSKIHQQLKPYLNEFDSLEDALGPNYQTVLNFWLYLDTFDDEQLENIGKNYCAIRRLGIEEGEFVSLIKTILPHEGTLWHYVTDAVRVICCRYCDYRFAIAWATHELIAMHKLIETGREIGLIKLFDVDT